ncbi:MAG TPA: ribonuclease P protein component [Beijerinckiaceae bacterium]
MPVGRLTKRADFLAAASGRRFHTERMTVQGRPRPDLAAPPSLRFGFTVTKRVGNAPQRNRIKRRLRVAARDAAAQLDAARPRDDIGPTGDTVAAASARSDGAVLDVVVIARQPLLSAPYETIVADLARALGTVRKPKSPSARPDRPGRSPTLKDGASRDPSDA